MRKTAALVMIITILSKSFGLLRDIILSYFYGASNISDAYLIALTIPGVIFSFISVAITTGYIPMYSRIEKDLGKEASLKYTSNIINLTLLVCTLIVFLTFLFTEEIVRLFASGFDEETVIIASNFTRILVIGIYFTGVVNIFSGYLQLKGNYTIPALIGFPLNVFFIISIIVSAKTNTIILAIGATIAYLSQLFFIIPSIRKKGYKHKLVINFKDENIIRMIYIAIPVILGTSINQINILIDRTLSSQIVIGGVSALNYADKLIFFVQGIFVMSISTVLFPTMSKMYINKDSNGFKKIIAESVTTINLLVIPSTFGFMIFSKEIITFLFGRGEFDSNAIELTSSALFFFSIGIIGFGLREVLSKAFYSMQDSKTPMINAVIGLIINIVLNIILSRYLGIGGLALATSISALITSTLLFLSLRKRIGSFGIKKIIISFLKIIFASCLMGLASKLSFIYFKEILNQSVSLLIAIVVGSLSYFIIVTLLKIEDVNNLSTIIKQKFKNSLK